jgi:uncharacterized protein (DUF1330 family)
MGCQLRLATPVIYGENPLACIRRPEQPQVRRPTMPAYLISTIEIHDPHGYEEYKKLVPPVLDKYGGRFVVRGGAIEYKEGDWRPKRVVVVEFESMDKARAFYDSPEYTRAKRIRQRTSAGSVLFVEGI